MTILCPTHCEHAAPLTVPCHKVAITVWRPNGHQKFGKYISTAAYLLVKLPLRCEAVLAGGGLADKLPVPTLAPKQHRYY